MCVPRSGNKYVGDWAENQPEGKGTKVYVDGDKYEGDWKGGLMEGRGTYTWSNGSIYEGSYSNDKKNGYGVLMNKEGEIVYAGEWRNGNPEGQKMNLFSK
jgi:hypothetical protein